MMHDAHDVPDNLHGRWEGADKGGSRVHHAHDLILTVLYQQVTWILHCRHSKDQANRIITLNITETIIRAQRAYTTWNVYHLHVFRYLPNVEFKVARPDVFCADTIIDTMSLFSLTTNQQLLFNTIKPFHMVREFKAWISGDPFMSQLLWKVSYGKSLIEI